MTSSSISTDSQFASDSVTGIKSRTGQRISRFFFWLTFSTAIILSIQAILPSLEFYRSQAEAEISSSLWSNVYVWGIFSTRNLIRLIFLGIGTLIYLRKPNDHISLYTSVFLLCFGSGGILYAEYAVDAKQYAIDNGMILSLPLSYVGWLMLFMYFIYFPDGRPVPRVAQLNIIPVMSFNIAFSVPIDSPWYAFNWHPVFLVLTMFALLGVPLGSQIYRYRKVSTPLQRAQTKWVVAGFFLAILSIMFVASLIGDAPEGSVKIILLATMGDGGFVLIPITLAIAMLRYRLWDIDVLINRSLAYVVVGGVALLLFFASLFALQLVIGQTQPIVALLIAGGVSALVYQPLRKRVQRFVDRRLYGLRFEIDELRANQLPPITNPGILSNKTLGDYQILDNIGSGGMGEVYKAMKGNELYAIKTLLSKDANNPEIITRFKREGDIGQQLNHPNIAKVHELEQDAKSGMLYLVMDYLDGQDLHQLLKHEERLDLATTAQIIQDLASALDTAHAQGMVHRDIKPSNVMVVGQSAILMDFGVSKIADANTLTKTGAIGTIGYMAPEQIVDGRQVDFYADIYSLGILAYEMLVGETPFTGGAAQVMFAHIQQPPPNPRDKDRTIPRPIAKAIMQALAKIPAERFESAGAFAQVFGGEVS